MKYFFKKIIVVVFCIQLIGCIKEYELPNDLIVHDFVWKGLNAYYLYQNEVDDLSDRRFRSDVELENYLKGFSNYQDLFSNLLIEQDTISTLLEDYSTIFSIPELRQTETNGLEFGIIAEPGSATNVIGYVTHILPNSNAANQDIKRGDFFNKVNGEQLTRSNFENLLLEITGSIILTKINFDGTTITTIPVEVDENIDFPTISSVTSSIQLRKQNYIYPQIFENKIIPLGLENIGYLIYNNDFSTNYLEAINTVFLDFKTNNISKLILDFRYNIGSGGNVENVNKIISMLSGNFSTNTTIKEQWNSKAQPWFLANQPDSLLTNVATQLSDATVINALSITDVYIILNGENYTGSSATELLINSLKPHINVHLFSRQTKGNNKGRIALFNSGDYNFENRNELHAITLIPQVLTFLNKDDEAYENGFTPDVLLCEHEDPLNLGELGDAEEPILKSVIEFIDSGTAIIGTTCPSSDFEFIFNSIDTQRETDTGLLIEQILPFTN